MRGVVVQLREDVRDVVVGGYTGNGDLACTDEVLHEEMPTSDVLEVLGARWIVRDHAGGGVVAVYGRRLVEILAALDEQVAQPLTFAGSC